MRMEVAEFLAHVIGQFGHGELDFVGSGALGLVVLGVEVGVTHGAVQRGTAQGHGIGSAIAVFISIVERPRLACHRCRVVVVNGWGAVVVVTAPLGNQVVFRIKTELLLYTAVAIGEPGPGVTDVHTGPYLAEGVGIIALFDVPDVYQGEFLTRAVQGIDVAVRLGVGVFAIEVA